MSDSKLPSGGDRLGSHEHRGRTFQNVPIFLDARTFIDCRFQDCVLIYRGGALPNIIDCEFTRPHFAFDGPARQTIEYLTELYHGLDESGRDLVEEIFRNIKRGQHPDLLGGPLRA